MTKLLADLVTFLLAYWEKTIGLLTTLSCTMAMCATIQSQYFIFYFFVIKIFIFTFRYILLILLLQLSQLFLFAALCPVPPTLEQYAAVNSCPGGMCVSSLASPFPILFLISPCLFCSYKLCFRIPTPFPPLSPFSLPADNPPNDPHTYHSIPVLLAYLVVVLFRFSC